MTVDASGRCAKEGTSAVTIQLNNSILNSKRGFNNKKSGQTGSKNKDIENTCSEEFANNILDSLAAMNAKLQKIDVIESLALETKQEVTGVNSRIDNISKQLEAVKADLKNKESNWEKGVTELRDRVSHIESGCSKIDKKWEQCKGFIKKELDIA